MTLVNGGSICSYSIIEPLGVGGYPVWSPDAEQLNFASGREGRMDLYLKTLSGAVPFDDSSTGSGRVLGEPFPVAQTGFDESQARFSPDGRWIAFVSNETGRQEVYVQSFPDLSRRRQISVAGGIYPRWGTDGSELFYIAPDLSLTAVSLDMSRATGPVTEDMPRTLFPTRIATSGPYVFTADEALAPPITITLNWRAGLGN